MLVCTFCGNSNRKAVLCSRCGRRRLTHKKMAWLAASICDVLLVLWVSSSRFSLCSPLTPGNPRSKPFSPFQALLLVGPGLVMGPAGKPGVPVNQGATRQLLFTASGHRVEEK